MMLYLGILRNGILTCDKNSYIRFQNAAYPGRILTSTTLEQNANKISDDQ